MAPDISLIQVDPSSFSKRRKLNTSACARCHERKVKCDAASRGGAPCKNCSIAGEACRSHRDGRTRRYDGTQREASSNTSWLDEHTQSPYHSPDLTDGNSVNSTPSMSAPQIIRADSSIGQITPCQTESTGRTPPLSLSDERTCAQDLVRDIPVVQSAPSTCITLPPSISAVNSQDLDSLNRFEAYVEDSLGSYAPSFRNGRLRAVHESGNHQQNWPETNTTELPPLAVDMSTRTTLALERQVAALDAADMEYLRAKGAFELPSREIQEDLVRSYFADVHPTAPVINRNAFLTSFYQQGNPNRLLLFAIFTSGSRACRNPALLDQKGTNQGSARRFYMATKALLDTGYERDRLIRVQALLLLTWWWDKKDDGGRNMRSCAVDAINTAQSIGMHRWDHYPKADVVLSRVWKRVWWTCFHRDVAVAVSHGLPCILSISDFDVPPLTVDDFVEEPNVRSYLRQYSYSATEVAFSIEIVKVAEALHQIHRRHLLRNQLHQQMTGPITDRRACMDAHQIPPGARAMKVELVDNYNDVGLQLCREWLDQVPYPVKYDVDDVQRHSFWPSFLHILYLTNIMLRFREKAVWRSGSKRGEAERQYCQARGIAAATMVNKIMRNVRAHDHLLRFTGQLTITLYNCLVFFLIEGQSSSAHVRRDAQVKYSFCLNMLYNFSQLWVSASLVHRLFEALQVHMHSPTPNFHDCAGPPADEQHVLLPGLRISSDVTESYLTQLLATDFSFEDSNVPELSFGQSIETFESEPSTQYLPQGMPSSLSTLDLPLGDGPGDTLNVDDWIKFFGLADGGNTG